MVERQLLGQMIMRLHRCKSEAGLLKSVVLGQGKTGDRIRDFHSTGVQNLHLNNVKVAAFCLTLLLPQRKMQDTCQKFLFLAFILCG